MGRFAACGFEGFGRGFMFPFPWIGIIFMAIGFYMFYHIMKTNNSKKDSNVLEILNMKYANGEIDEETYLKKKSVITGKTKI